MTDTAPEPTACDGVDPYSHIVELRVHGVSGTPPEALLDRAEVRQVAGDTIAGFYRPSAYRGLRDHQPNTNGAETGPGLEAYSWGGITSGARTRALWLIFFPFALANVAPRMLPPTREALATRDATSDRDQFEHHSRITAGVLSTHRWAHWLFRVLAISLTISIVYGATVIGVIFLGQACVSPAGGATCYALPGFVRAAFARWPVGLSVILGAAVPALILGAMWFLSHIARQRYEERTFDAPPETPDPGARAPEDCEAPLLRNDLWTGTLRILRMRRIHAKVAASTVIALLWLAIPPGTRTSTGWAGDSYLQYLVPVLTLATIAYALVAVARSSADTGGTHGWSYWSTWATVWIAAASTILDLILGWNAAKPTMSDITLAVQRLDTVWRWLYVAQAVTILLIAVCCLRLQSKLAGVRQLARMWGLAGAVVAFLAWLSALIITNAVILLAGAWLFVDGFSLTPTAITTFVSRHATLIGDATLSAGYGMMAAIFALLAAVVTTVAVRRSIRKRLTREYTADGAEPQPSPDDVTRMIKIHTVGALVDRITVITVIPVGILVAYLIAQALGYAGRRRSGWVWRALAVLHVDNHDVNAPVVALGATLTAGLLAVIILVAVASYRSKSTRRGVGVLWDLACFWPRDVHPLAPPAYSERTVPELVERIRSYQRADNPIAIVLAAHSQGTIISAAALLAEREPPRALSLLTFGTVQARIYARVFPRYFNARTFEALAARCTGGWVNLWRRSDFIGGRIVDDDWRAAGYAMPGNLSERELIDPYPVSIPPYAVTHTPPLRHSAFWHDPAYHEAVADLVRPFAVGGDRCIPGEPEHRLTAAPRTVL